MLADTAGAANWHDHTVSSLPVSGARGGPPSFPKLQSTTKLMPSAAPPPRLQSRFRHSGCCTLSKLAQSNCELSSSSWHQRRTPELPKRQSATKWRTNSRTTVSVPSCRALRQTMENNNSRSKARRLHGNLDGVNQPRRKTIHSSTRQYTTVHLSEYSSLLSARWEGMKMHPFEDSRLFAGIRQQAGVFRTRRSTVYTPNLLSVADFTRCCYTDFYCRY